MYDGKLTFEKQGVQDNLIQQKVILIAAATNTDTGNVRLPIHLLVQYAVRG